MDTSDDWRVITVEDWALIRKLAADGVPKAEIASGPLLKFVHG